MQDQNPQENLQKVIGVRGLSLGIVNMTIGAGIFALPGTIGMLLGSYSFIAYLFCSIMMASIMWSYAQIGSKIDASGGSYSYVKEAFGLFPAYIINCLYFFGWTMLSSAALMNLVADSLAQLNPIFSNPMFRNLFFMSLMSVTIIINVIGAKHTLTYVKIVSILKLLPLIFIIGFGVFHINLEYFKFKGFPEIKTFADASLILFFAFAGFECALGNSGEIKDAKTTVPKGIVIGGLIVFMVYLSLQLVVQGILGDAISQYKDAPLAAVAEKLFGRSGSIMILLATAVSCYGNVAADIFGTSRLLYAGGQDRLFPEILSRVNKSYKTPYVAIIVYALGILVFTILGGFKQLAILASASILIIYLTIICAQLKMANISKEATFGRNTKLLNLIIAGIGISSIIWLLSGLSVKEMIATALFILLTVISYLVRRGVTNAGNSIKA